MSLVSAVGYSNEINGREAAQQAAQQALKGLRSASPKAALVFFSNLYDPLEVRQVLAGLLGNIPLWGATTSTVVAGGAFQKMVVVLLGGSFSLDTTWLGDYALDPPGSAIKFRERLERARGNRQWHSLLLAADGVNGEISALLPYLGDLPMQVGGLLGGAGFPHGSHSLLGETECAAGALSALWLGAGSRVRMATADGWKDSGVSFRVTASRANRLIALDGRAAAESICAVLGYSPAEWRKPPLRDLLRLFPLAFRESGQEQPVVAAPLVVEEDGSLRMNVAVPQGCVLSLMVADAAAGRQSIQTAVRSVREQVGDGQPVVAMILLDEGWFELFRTQSAKLVGAIHEAAGDMPYFGVATLGHIWHGGEDASPLATNLGALVVAIEGDSHNAS